MEWLRLGLAALIAGLSMIFGLAINLSPPTGDIRFWLHLVLAVAAIIVFLLVGQSLCQEAWVAARQKKIVVEQMFLLGILGAFGSSLICTLTGEGAIYYEVVSVLLAIYTFGRLIGDKRRQAALQAANSLELEYSTAIRLTSTNTQEIIPVQHVRVDDQLRVLTGENITCDGIVTEGVAFVREASITGEPFPVVKRPGDLVWAGSQVLDHPITLRATHSGTARKIDQLLQVVQQAHAKPGSLQREADRLVSWFLPIVVTISLLTFFYWTYHASWTTGIFTAMAVFLVACPCALGLATPIAVWSAINQFARHGLLAQSGDIIERLATVNWVAFDKTGTLSEDELRVVDFVTAPGYDRQELQALAAAIQNNSRHPVARAFHSWQNSNFSFSLSDIISLPGIGLKTDLAEKGTVSIGNSSLVQSHHAQEWHALRSQLQASPTAGQDIYFTINEHPVAIARLAERLRDGSATVLEQLRDLGISTSILTGDTLEHAQNLGLHHVSASLTPEEKVSHLQARQKEGYQVLFLGDGLNDASALATANVSIALASGAGLSRATAHAQLFGSNLSCLPAALVLARKVRRGIRHNIFFAAAYNVIGITLAVTGLLHPIAAALLMLAASGTVTWRALQFASQLERPVRADRALFSLPQAQKRQPSLALITAICLTVQGPLLSYLGHATPLAILFVSLLFWTMALLALHFWKSGPPALTGQSLAVMAGPGCLGMLLGWWADAGFGAIIRDGACLCGCAKSHLGWGLIAHVHWMHFGMIIASFPIMLFFRDNLNPLTFSLRSRFSHAGWGTIGMFIGMLLAMLVMSQISIVHPSIHFFLTYGAMVFGMLLGMVTSCLAWQKITTPRPVTLVASSSESIGSPFARPLHD
jgi:P-type Cu+ transporter